MTTEEWFWKAFKATGSPELFLIYNVQSKKRISQRCDEQEKRSTGL
ncbi:hypothetical protein Sgly_0251 [Syntrophobotulus glycolicus DSM 8271]|uniref:YqzL family protein n=1 Tax=Syntrophobotulus glycolicus (strain DSM 8271 / FlGlyR) TaxID=645991 RepID=F0SWT0_SYNGF|nr:hypothetical protein [Syntrophobotulus glycolicus]ADY54620.1 hypothetical protein Sgly_0251 [Syntrophobotulus glycolicus DSM 8271]